MKDIYSAPLMTIICTFFMFLIPLSFQFGLFDYMAQILITDSVYDFVNDSCATGFISYQKLDEMYSTIGSTGNLYTISIEHRSKKAFPLEAGGYAEHYESYFNDEIIPALFDSAHNNQVYPMKNGDYLRVSVALKSDTLRMRLNNLLTTSTAAPGIYANYGLRVGNNKGE